MKKALFLDRDGVINQDVSYLSQPRDFQFLDGIFDLCRTAQEKGYLIIVVTNQSGIARGYYTESDFLSLTNWMCAKFEEQGITISKVYYCPFHPERGVGPYRRESEDRKPKPGMILKASDEFTLNLDASILIGDKDSDVQAGRSAGVGTLLLMPKKYETQPAQDVHVIRELAEGKLFL